MPESIMLANMPDGVSRVGQPEGVDELTSRDIREGNTQGDCGQRHSMPLGFALTGNLLFTMGGIVGLGIPKAVSSYRGQSLIVSVLDWVEGIVFALILLVLGEIRSQHPGLWLLFFEVDLAPFILKFLCCDDVHLWFASTLHSLLFVEYVKRLVAENVITSEIGAPFIKDVSVLSPLIFLFCIHGLKILWSNGFQGNRRYAFVIALMMGADTGFFVCLSMNESSNDSIFLILMIMKMNRFYIWMFREIMLELQSRRTLAQHLSGRCNHEGPEFFFKLFSGFHDPRFGRYFTKFFTHLYTVIWGVYAVSYKVSITYTWGPEFPETLYSFLLLCYALARIFRELSAIIPSSWATWFTSVWKAAYDSALSAGSKAKVYVLDIYHRF